MNIASTLLKICAVILLAFGAQSAHALTEDFKLIASDAALFDFFGSSVSVSGDTAVIGAYEDGDGGSNSGSAYVYARSGGVWVQQAKLTANDAAVDDRFGASVSIYEDTILVGAPLDNDGGNNSGSIYVFMLIGGVWTQQAKFRANDAAVGDRLGDEISVDKDTAVVAASGDDDGGENSGSAYVFTRIGGVWTQQAKLTASDAVAGDEVMWEYFGSSVSVSGDTIVVGAYLEEEDNYWDSDGGADFGGAYVFTRSNGGDWTQEAKLTASDAERDDYFGGSVSISGDTALIGARGVGIGDTGSAYVFKRSGGVWTQEIKLTADDIATGDDFGYNVSVFGDVAVIGSKDDDDRGTGSGSAYVFLHNNGVWVQQAKLTASDAAASDSFGSAVSVSGDTVVVGADRDDDGGSNSGSAYVFELVYLSADQNNDYIISFSELMRMIQFYNIGAFHCDALGEDGFNPGVGDTTCTPHSSDYNPQDWSIGFDELLRVIQLYNAYRYYSCPGVGEDGFCPGMP